MCGPLVEPGAAAALPDGTALALGWVAARGCYGGQAARPLLLGPDNGTSSRLASRSRKAALCICLPQQ